MFFFYLKRQKPKERGSETEQVIFHLLLLSLSEGLLSQQEGLVRSKPGAWDSSQVSHVTGSDPRTEGIFCCLPKGITAGLETKNAAGAQILYTLMWDAGIQNLKCWKSGSPGGLLLGSHCAWAA